MFTGRGRMLARFGRSGVAMTVMFLMAVGLWAGYAYAETPDKGQGKPQSPDAASYVYHEQSGNGIGESCGTYTLDSDRSPDAGWQMYEETYRLQFKVDFQFFTDQSRVYYTTDGSTPSASFGTPFGTTKVATTQLTCTFSDETQSGQTVDVIAASIPAQAAGTTVKYIIGAWHSGGGPEVYANSGTCSGCVSCTSGTQGCATVFQYNTIGGGCSILGRFSDVPQGSTFYEWVECLYCRGAISGYNDGTFRPGALTTRGQLAKIVALAFNFGEFNPPNNRFADVPVGSTFFGYIEAMASRELIGGYPCNLGSAFEPCDAQSRPYFRPGSNVTRGQLAKIVVGAAQQGLGWSLVSTTEDGRSFHDVHFGSTYFQYIETAACHGMIGGYTCGGAGEPCGDLSRPYFREANNATRGQISKIVCTAVRNNISCAQSSAEMK